MNLIGLTSGEVAGLEAKAGDLHGFKPEIMHESRDVSRFDVFNDIDHRVKRIDTASKWSPETISKNGAKPKSHTSRRNSKNFVLCL
jgi:hypothetical protein